MGQEEGFCSVKVSQQSVRMTAIFVNFQNPNKPFSKRKQTFLNRWNGRRTCKKNLTVKTVEIGEFKAKNFRL